MRRRDDATTRDARYHAPRRASPTLARVLAVTTLVATIWCARAPLLIFAKATPRDADGAADALRNELETLRNALSAARDASEALERAVRGAEGTLKRMDGLIKVPGVAVPERDGATCETSVGDSAATPTSELLDASYVSPETNVPIAARTMDAALEEIRRVTEEHVRAALSGHTQRVSTFSDAFKRVSSAMTTRVVTAAHVLPFKYGREIKPRYYIVGDAGGGLTVRHFESGEHACESETSTRSAVRSITAYLSSLNTTVLVTGHDDGTVAFTKIERQVNTNRGPDADEFPEEEFLRCALVSSITAKEANERYKDKLLATGKKIPTKTGSNGVLEQVMKDAPIETLGLYRIMGKRYVAAADIEGRVVIFQPREDNLSNIQGVFRTGSRVFAFRPYKKAVVALTQRGVAYADVNAFTTRSYSCEGLDRIEIAKATFDSRMNSRVTGITKSGQVISGFVVLDGPQMGCTIHLGSEVREPRMFTTAIATVKGYAVVAMNGGDEVLNLTSTKVGKHIFQMSNPQQLASEGVEAPQASAYAPVVVSDGEKRVIIAHGDVGSIFVYENAMYVSKPPGLLGDNLWFQPLAVMLALGVGIWSYKNQRAQFMPDASARRQTEDALRKLGYGKDMAKARELVTGEPRKNPDGYEHWTPAMMQREIEAARANGDL